MKRSGQRKRRETKCKQSPITQANFYKIDMEIER